MRMRTFGAVLLAACVLGGVARAEAACSFAHPAQAKAFRGALVQAFVPCELAYVNAASEGGVPSCLPAETFAESDGARPAAWLFGPKGTGSARLGVKGGDLTLSVSLNDVQNASGAATGTGAVALLLRLTLVDPTNGAMTTMDAPISFALAMTGGKAKLKTSVFANPLFQDLAGSCMSFELVTTPRIIDPIGSPFATVGLYLR